MKECQDQRDLNDIRQGDNHSGPKVNLQLNSHISIPVLEVVLHLFYLDLILLFIREKVFTPLWLVSLHVQIFNTQISLVRLGQCDEKE